MSQNDTIKDNSLTCLIIYGKIQPMMKKTKILIVVLCLILNLFTFTRVGAFTFPSIDFSKSTASIASSVNIFFNFFGQTVLGKIRGDFCENYYTAIAKGDWKGGEFRTDLGIRICPKTPFVSPNTSSNSTSNPSATTSSKIFIKKPTNIKPPTFTTKVDLQKISETPGPLVGDTTPDGAKINQSQIIYWTNIERSKVGLPALSPSSSLNSIALARVNDMFEKGYFEHISPTGDSVSKMSDRFSYKYIYIGENIAMGNFENARVLLDAWMASEGHKENILNNKYTEIGVSAVEAKYKDSLVWISAQVFGKPLSSCPTPNPTKKAEIETKYATSDTMEGQAKNLLAEINNTNPSSNPTYYNSRVYEYNNLVNSINTLIIDTKQLITDYNKEITAYNNCIKK